MICSDIETNWVIVPARYQDGNTKLTNNKMKTTVCVFLIPFIQIVPITLNGTSLRFTIITKLIKPGKNPIIKGLSKYTDNKTPSRVIINRLKTFIFENLYVCSFFHSYVYKKGILHNYILKLNIFYLLIQT